MQDNLMNRIGLRILTTLFAFATAAGLQVLAAGAEPVPGTAAVRVQSQKPVTAAKIKEPVKAVGCKTALKSEKPYFVEFRSRTAASFGHTFVFYGRLSSGDKFASFQIAGLHPAGDSAVTYAAGLMVPVSAETGVSDGDLDEQYLTARYCVTLSEPEFKKVVAYIKQLQSEKKTWHGSSYNCNSFAGDIAKFIGLKTPSIISLVYPEVFINNLLAVNSGEHEVPNIPYIEWGKKPPPENRASAGL